MHMKLAWRICQNEDREWIKVYKNKYMEGTNTFLSLKNPPIGSSFWNRLVDIRDNIAIQALLEINNGQTILFWDEKWLDHTSLVDQPNLYPLMIWAKIRVGMKISNYFSHNEDHIQWNISIPENPIMVELQTQLLIKLNRIPLYPS